MSTGVGTTYKTNAERRPVKVTPSLEFLQASRKKKTERDVEDEFARLQAEKKAAAKGTTGASPKPKEKKETPAYESLNVDIGGDNFGFSREKSKNLMLNS